MTLALLLVVVVALCCARVTETTVDLGYRPRAWQDRAHRAMRRFSVLVVHRRGGKTVLAIAKLVDAALSTSNENARFAYIAPFRVQAKAIAWDYLKQFARKIPSTVINEGELHVTFPNGAQIRIYGADNAEALRGIYLDGVVCDEVADMQPHVWGEILRPALADRQGWALFIGTPKGMNLFSELYYAARDKPDWYADLFTYADTQTIAPSEIDAARATMTERQFAQEFLCDFSAGNANALLSVADVDAACRRHLRADQYAFAAKIIGIDVARQGDDSSSIIRRQGLASWAPKVIRGADSMQVAGLAAAEIDDWTPDAVFVDGSGGYGAGVIDRLRQLGHVVHEVQFGGRPNDARFANKRAEMWWRMAEWVKGGAHVPNDSALKLDLCAPNYDHANAQGKLALESKDDLKARGMPSPDRGDSLALTFAEAVAARAEQLTRASTRIVSDYDPMSEMRGR